MQLEPDQLAIREAMDRRYLAIFEENVTGAVVFEDLFRRFAARAKVHTQGGIDAVLKTYQDAAHREVLDYIVTRCNRARGVDDSPPEPDTED
jgi:hypothetical protein